VLGERIKGRLPEMKRCHAALKATHQARVDFKKADQKAKKLPAEKSCI
jgi:hypothetical protein